jgi:hypothetical protein
VLDANDARSILERRTFRFNLLHSVRTFDRIACAEEDVIAWELGQLESGEISQTLAGASDKDDLDRGHGGWI